MNKHYERFFQSEGETKSIMGSLQTLINAIWPRSAKGEDAEKFVPWREALDSGLSTRDAETHDA